MTTEILTLFLPVGKFILATALLVLFYQLLYKGKTTYDQSRLYLLSLALVALLVSQFRVVVYTPPTKFVEVNEPLVIPTAKSTIESAIFHTETNSRTIPPTKKTPEPTVAEVIKTASVPTNSLPAFPTVQNIVFLGYGLVTLLLFLSFLIQYFKIVSIKRKGVVRQRDGFEIVESDQVPTPFSFCKSIFIGKNLSGNKLDVIIKHEQ